MSEKKYLIDTTLRDGEQRAGLSFTPQEKLKIASLLDSAGIYQIEAGIPAMGSREKETICAIMDARKKARIAVWNRMNLSDINHSIDCRPDVIHIGVSVSYTHIYSMLMKNKTWLINRLKSCVSYALEKGYKVTVGLQDASRADITFISTLMNILSAMGVEHVRLADTVGILTPQRISSMITSLRANTDIKIGIHTHNDLGMALANAFEAAKSGADFIDTTLFGIGERAGNCDMRQFVKTAGAIYDISPSYSEVELIQRETRAIIFRKG